MSEISGINWTQSSLPIVTGCNKVNIDCINCFAINESRRMAGNPLVQISSRYAGTTRRLSNGHLDWTGKVKVIPEVLSWLRQWRDGRLVFVCPFADLFHVDVPYEFIGEAFDEMIALRRHVYQVLTKRVFNATEFVKWYLKSRRLSTEQFRQATKHIWFGFSAGHQTAFDESIMFAMQIPFNTIWLSAEPLISRLDIRTGIGILKWIVIGGESAKKADARAMHPRWLARVLNDADYAGIPKWFKQWGSYTPYQPDNFRRIGSRHSHKFIWLAEDGTVTDNGQLRFYDDSRTTPQQAMYYVGKKKAGRKLDGIEYSEMPRCHLNS